MRLSDWQATPRGQQVMTEKVRAAYGPAMAVLGAPADPISHLVWGDDAEHRYLIFAVADAGLVIVNVRVNVPQEGPRASAKLVRWGRLTVGELSVEAHHGHRHVTSQIEGVVLQGSDDDADEIGAFVAEVLARIDGRTTSLAAAAEGGSRRSGRRSSAKAPDPNARSVSSMVPIELPAPTEPA
ncbi:MAG TPA: hypothetical protein VIF84_01565 [Candidatus Limnocylindrales bacterium]|jgi:hypothetical protein